MNVLGVFHKEHQSSSQSSKSQDLKEPFKDLSSLSLKQELKKYLFEVFKETNEHSLYKGY